MVPRIRPGEPSIIMSKPKSPSKPAKAASKPARESRRLWLNYPRREITQPLIWQLGQKFPVVFNIRQASVSDEIGILCLELEGIRDDLKKAISWLEKQGVRVEPVEIGAIDS
jgi:ABC-type methionine transport system ATPase subunit